MTQSKLVSSILIDSLFTVFEKETLVYNFSDLKEVKRLYTKSNEHGMIDTYISKGETLYLATLSNYKGCVWISNLPLKKQKTLNVHDS